MCVVVFPIELPSSHRLKVYIVIDNIEMPETNSYIWGSLYMLLNLSFVTRNSIVTPFKHFLCH